MSDVPETSQPAVAETAVSPPPQVIELKTSGSGRGPIWLLVGLFAGFLLPICACAVLFTASIAGLGSLDTGGTRPVSSGSGDAVAIVRVAGTILDGDEEDLPGAISGRVIADLRAAEADNTVKAIILRVDSPGGTVTGSAQIYEELLTVQKPIVVSMAGVAASGGYYISAPADHIFARPDTTTGSLGVVITLLNAEELIDDIGVDVVTITSGPNKTIGSAYEDLTEDQRDIFEQLIDESYNDFVQVIVNGRNLPEEKVRELADGRIYSGRQAVDNGLVDELGNLQDAIDKAAELGGISGEPRIVEYERLPGFEQLLSGLNSRLNRSQTDEIMEIIADVTTPALEYRYVPAP